MSTAYRYAAVWVVLRWRRLDGRGFRADMPALVVTLIVVALLAIYGVVATAFAANPP